MINKELIKSYVNQLSIEQLKRIVFEVINHYELNEEYYVDTIINNIVYIVNKPSTTIDRVDYLSILKENTSLFESDDAKVVNDSIKIIGYDNLFNNVKIEYRIEPNNYPYYATIDINKIEEREKLNNLKSAPL